MRKRNPSSGPHYFTQEHEDAIISYCETSDRYKKNKIFEKTILPVFHEMIDKIVFTFKFTSLSNVDVLKDECLVYLVTILPNFDKSKGFKAFGYFSVIIKNYFIAAVKKQNSRLKNEISWNDVHEDDLVLDGVSGELGMIENEKWTYIHSHLLSWSKESDLRENEKKVLDAIIHLIQNKHNLDLENKRAVYLYLRELTGLNTKQINPILTSFKKRYSLASFEWDNDINEGESEDENFERFEGSGS